MRRRIVAALIGFALTIPIAAAAIIAIDLAVQAQLMQPEEF